jgi:hypothetical protein
VLVERLAGGEVVWVQTSSLDERKILGAIHPNDRAARGVPDLMPWPREVSRKLIHHDACVKLPRGY